MIEIEIHGLIGIILFFVHNLISCSFTIFLSNWMKSVDSADRYIFFLSVFTELPIIESD